MFFVMRRYLVLILPALFLAGCGAPGTAPRDPRATIEIDLEALDADGLRGPPDGKVAVDYEFVIPDTAAAREAVSRIDPSVEFMPGSRGRIGAKPGECLCIGSTHQPRHREILLTLAGLPEIARIIECYHE
jgi:hypothetical protein